jgi:ATP-binding cassette, subfamily B, bacterial MsbA
VQEPAVQLQQPDQPGAAKSRPRRIPFDARARGLLSRFLKDWLSPRWRQLVAVAVLIGLLAAATGAYPLVIKFSFDTLMKGDVGYLPYVLTAIVGVTIARSVFLYLATVGTQRIMLRMSADIQEHAFKHLMAADFARLSRDAPGRLMSKLTNDIQFIQQAALAGVNTVIRDSLSVIALIASMIYLDWVMALVVLGVYPFAAIPISIIARKLRSNATRTQDELGGLTALLSEKLGGARLIKTFRLESYASERLQKSFERVFRLRLKAVSSKAWLEALLEALGGLAVAGVIWLAYWRIASGTSTVGDFMGFTTALLMSAQPIRAVGNLVAKVQEGLAAVDSLYGLLDEKPAVVDRPGATDLAVSNGRIVFENVAFRYNSGASGLAAVERFSLNVQGGQTVAFVGRSGAGKSTVINLVPRLFDVTDGSIKIDGQDLRDVTVASLRNNISIVSQDVTLFDDTIRANIELGRLGAPEADVIAAAKAAAAHDFILAQPNGYDTQIGDRGSRLSGGQRQRIGLARAILKNAPILLLDEATSALDTESEELVQEALRTFTKGRTTLVIAHRLSTIESADLICVMEDGTIVETGKHQELLARGGHYARLARAQLLGVIDETKRTPVAGAAE